MLVSHTAKTNIHFSIRAMEMRSPSQNTGGVYPPIHEYMLTKINTVTGKAQDIFRSPDLKDLIQLVQESGITFKLEQASLQSFFSTSQMESA
jgi:hypothetical protein